MSSKTGIRMHPDLPKKAAPVASETPLGPAEIRALRGGRTRAAFASEVGVTPLTVYRWELPDGASQARRPRGAELERLRSLLPARPPATPKDASSESAEHAIVLPALERIPRGDWERSERELVSLLAARRLTPPQLRPLAALAAVGLAQIEIGLRGDAQRAFAALAPALADADADLLPPPVEAQVRAIAAVVYSWPDGRLFHVGRAQAYALQAEALLGPEGAPEARFLAWFGRMNAAFAVGDLDLLERAFSRADEVLGGLPPLWELFADESRATEALVGGRPTVAARRFEQIAARAAEAGYALLEARSLAMLSVRRLDDLTDPDAALALARRAQEVARRARLGPGLHTMFAARGAGEALARLGRFDEAAAAFADGEASAREAGIPALQLVPAQIRFLLLAGRHADLDALAGRLRTFEAGPARPLVVAYVASIEALLALARGAAGARVLEAFERAERDAARWVFLQRELLVFVVPAFLAAERLPDAAHAVRRAHRFLERFPSPWCTATLRHYEGMLLAAEGRTGEAKQLLEAALGTFSLAGDLPAATLARRSLADLGVRLGEPDADARLRQSDAELARLGMPLPPPATMRIQPAAAALPAEAPSAAGPSLGALVAPIQRLSVRGVGASLVERELLAVLRELFPARRVLVEEVGVSGAATLLGAAGPESAGPLESVEFGDGSGRRLRIGLSGPLAGETRGALSAIATVAGLALEVARLRGFAEPAADAHPRAEGGETEPDLPGFIAASPAMRRLRGELARLSASRSTIIVTGESGVGKEVVARAIHALSTRSTHPFVAFNCAAVPRDLFEGQLFGYKKGAFTGAVANHPGVIRGASGGTLFLDEVGELPLDVQPKLLRFLENGEMSPLGESRPLNVDVRIVAATHRDLAALVREGRFREDLYYRLHVVPLHVPPLRERPEDLLALARHFVRANTPAGSDPPVLAPDAVARLAAHAWPGNVRELRNVIERSMAFAPLPAVLTAKHVRL